jgi:hypothetical protein
MNFDQKVIIIKCNVQHVINYSYLHKDKKIKILEMFFKCKTLVHLYVTETHKNTKITQKKHCSIPFKLETNHQNLF